MFSRSTQRSKLSNIGLDRSDPLNIGLLACYPMLEGAGDYTFDQMSNRAKWPNSVGGRVMQPDYEGYGEHWRPTNPGAFGGAAYKPPGYGSWYVRAGVEPPVHIQVQKFTISFRVYQDPSTFIIGDAPSFGSSWGGGWANGWAFLSYGTHYLYLDNYGEANRPTIAFADVVTRKGYVNVVATYNQQDTVLYMNSLKKSVSNPGITIKYEAGHALVMLRISHAQGAEDIRLWDRALTNSEALRYINEGPAVGSMNSPSRRFATLQSGAAPANINQRFPLLGVGD